MAALLVALLAHCLLGGRAEYSSAALSAHVDTLLAEYDREVPPLARTRVALSLDVRHAAVDDAAASMRLLADLKMVWTDGRLAWNASAWDGDSALVADARLWTPDVRLASAGVARPGAGAGLRARLRADGGVTRVLRLDLSAPVALQLARWPEDAQRADFEFAARAPELDELELTIADHKGSVVVECGAWEVESVSGATVRRGAADVARWSVRAARRGAAARLQHGAVLATAALLLGAATARPLARRVPLAACAALVASLWLLTASVAVPPGASAPRIVSLMCAASALGACGAAGAALAQAVSRRAGPAPAVLRRLLAELSIAPEPESLREGRCGAWAAAARLLDVALGALLALALLVLLAVHLLG